MRIVTMICGIILALLGVFSAANEGLSFISVAFPVGIVMIFTGIVEWFAYKKSSADEENKHWILIEAYTTFAIGFIVLTGQLAADIVVLAVFGMWNMISGIRGLVVVFHQRDKNEKNIEYYWALGVSIINFLVGLCAFYNSVLFRLPVLAILGFGFAVQGANVVKFGLDIPYVKPDLIKTKDERIADAQEAAEVARKEAKKAIHKARNARTAIKKAEKLMDFEEKIAEPIEPGIAIPEKEEEAEDK